MPVSRRDALKQIGAASAGIMLGGKLLGRHAADIMIAGQPVEIAVASLSDSTVRITVRPIQQGAPAPLPVTGELVSEALGKTIARAGAASSVARVAAGDLVVKYSDAPPTVHVETRAGAQLQRLTFDAANPGMSFLLGQGPLLGLGEGGPQFDRKGSVDKMIIGQGGYRLATHGTRAPIQWLVGTDGWAMFIHQPFGTFDFTGTDGKFAPPADAPATYDMFIVSSREPAVIMREYARITGLPEMPARWAFGYQQSHRTLAGPDEILGVARTLREKKLPCDTLIYLGTEFARRDGTRGTASSPGIRPTFPSPRNNSRRCTTNTSRSSCTSSSKASISPARSTIRARPRRCRVVGRRTITGRPIDKCRAIGRFTNP
jgi:Alpha-glucosidases, family 31 of glycosyl hydrolases